MPPFAYFELLGAEPGAFKQVREGLWEEKLCAIAGATKIELQMLPATNSSPAKVLIAALMKKVTSVSNGWLAARLVMGGPSSVSSLVSRFQRMGGTESPQFRAIHSRFAS